MAGCAGNVTIPSLGLDHPANPRAAAAPLPPTPTVPEAKKVMADMRGMQGHGAHEHAGEHGPSAAGQPGDQSQVDRTIEITAHDSMSYTPQSLTVKPGEIIRFAVTNAGKIRHEFVIGTPEEQREHAQMMAQMPNMVHEDPSSVTLEPGGTKTLVWQFSNPGVVEFACHVPGHYPAGMVGKVHVATAGRSDEGQPQMEMDDMQGMDHDMEGMPHAH
ncbi:MAG: cupredoxin domain-containing protein [Gammaproteobacteria bacterium]